MTLPSHSKILPRTSALVLAVAAGAAGTLALSAMFVRSDGASAAQPVTHAAGATEVTGLRADDYVMRRFVVPGSWQNMKSEAKAFGLSRLYVIPTDSPFHYGPTDSVWFVGTYSRNCLVSVGYPSSYSEVGIHGAPNLSVQVF